MNQDLADLGGDRDVRNLEPAEIERIRRIFAAHHGPRRPDCPDADSLAAAVAGELTRPRLDAVLDHVAGCPACSADWRLARELYGGLTADGIPTVATWWQTQRRVFLPLAAGLALAVGGYLLYDKLSTPPTPVFLGTPESALGEVRPADDLPLGRARPVLRWTPVAEHGATYDVRVETLAFVELASATGLTEPRLAIPPEAFSALPPGATVRCEVTVRRPDGTPETWSFLKTIE